MVKCCDVYLTLRVGGIKDFLGVDRLRSCGVKKWILLKKGLQPPGIFRPQPHVGQTSVG